MNFRRRFIGASIAAVIFFVLCAVLNHFRWVFTSNGVLLSDKWTGKHLYKQALSMPLMLNTMLWALAVVIVIGALYWMVAVLVERRAEGGDRTR